MGNQGEFESFNESLEQRKKRDQSLVGGESYQRWHTNQSTTKKDKKISEKSPSLRSVQEKKQNMQTKSPLIGMHSKKVSINEEVKVEKKKVTMKKMNLQIEIVEDLNDLSLN